MDLTSFQTYLSINVGQKTALNYLNMMKSFFQQYTEFNQENVNKYLASKIDIWCPAMFNLFFAGVKKYCLFTKTEVELPKVKRVERKARPYIQEVNINEIITKLPVLFNDFQKVRCVVKLLFLSGMRPKELYTLKRKNVLLDEHKIILENTKTKKSRTIFLTPEIEQDIAVFFNREPEGDNAFNLKKKSVQYYCQKIAKNFNIKITPYMLRHCVSIDTEVLTEQGWKKYNEINGLKIFTLNQISKKFELMPLKNIHSYNYKGKMYVINNRYLDLKATPEHSMYTSFLTTKYINGVEKYHSLSWKLNSLQDILKFPNLYYAKSLLTAKTNQSLNINNSLAFILGVILTDGNIHKRKYTRSISISQSLSANPHKCKLIEYHLKKSKLQFTKCVQPIKINGYNNKPYQMIVYRIRTVSQNIILKYLNEDNSPKTELILLSYKNLKNIFDGLMLGDGCRNKEFCDQNLKNIKFIQIIGTLINKNIQLSFNEKYRTYITNKTFYNIKKKDIKIINYNGVVWCPETENGTWIAKRNDKVFISGNSFSHAFLKKTNNNLVALSKMLGHTSIKTTQIYSDIDEKELQDIYNKAFKNKRKKK